MQERKLQELIKASGASSPATRIYHLSDFDPLKFIEETQTFPLLAPKQVLVLKEANRLNKSAKEVLASSLSSIPSFSLIVFEADEISKGDLLYEWVMKQGSVIELSDMNAEEKEPFVRDLLKREGKKITEDALELLLEKSGGNLALLSESLEKLILNSGDKVTVGPEAVLALSEEGSSFDGFDLINAFARRDIAYTLKILDRLFETLGEAPTEIIGIINWHFKRLWQAQEMLELGRSSYEVGKELRIPRYFLNDFLKQAKQFGEETLRKIFQRLVDLG